MRPLKLALMIVASYLLAGALQLAVFGLWTPAPAVPRMAWEVFPLNLVLIPLAPVLTFDTLLREQTPNAAGEFLPFLVPFLLGVMASFRRLYRRNPATEGMSKDT